MDVNYNCHHIAHMALGEKEFDIPVTDYLLELTQLNKVTTSNKLKCTKNEYNLAFIDYLWKSCMLQQQTLPGGRLAHYSHKTNTSW